MTEASPGWVVTDGAVQAEVTVSDSGADALAPFPWQLAPREAVTVKAYVPGAVAAVVATLKDEVNAVFVVTGLFPKAAVAPAGGPLGDDRRVDPDREVGRRDVGRQADNAWTGLPETLPARSWRAMSMAHFAAP